MNRKTRFIAVIALLLSVIAQFQTALASGNISKITSQELKNELYADDAQVKILFVFTSWCGVCKRSMPDLTNLHEKFAEGKEAKIIALSIDHDLDKLEQYVGSIDARSLYISALDFSSSRDIITAFKELDVNYNGSIPYIVIAYNGKLLASGNYDVNSLYNAVLHIRSDSRNH
ncbi:thioredoxin family protein [Candidatus Lariskella endosymbiont of Hedychridium roseum]|uniref:thioredoxin family protein n=1 Tax=Candidatus Lariskella endosymbiont of Hedychridium roseum TaxID=3077949 RepID=UPI0030D12265